MASPPGDTMRGNLAAWLLLAALLVAFDVLKVASIEPSYSDENIYYYMGKLASEGCLPYRDFRFAHPPLRLAPPALLFLALGFDFTALKLLPVAAANLAALLVFLVARRALGPLAALAAAAAFLLSYPGLLHTSHYLGPGLANVFLLAGLLAFVRGRDLLAGAGAALAALTGLYAGCAAAALGILLLLTGRHRLKAFVGGFLLVFLPVNLACLAVGGEAFLRHVYLFHFLKPGTVPSPRGEALLGILLDNPALLLLVPLYLFRRERGADPAFVVGLSFLALLLAYSSVHAYHFLLAAPFLAISGTAALLGVLRRLRLPPAAVGIGVGIGLAVFGGFHLAHALGTFRAVAFSRAEEMVRTVEVLTAPEDALFGQAEVAPLLALMADREILDRHVDTNGKVYLTGVADLSGIRRSVSARRGTLLVFRSIDGGGGRRRWYGPMMDDAFWEFFLGNAERVASFPDPDEPADRIEFFRIRQTR